ncbi:Chs6p SCDLUD_003666 [Saccharomycodes ludwigii]|uniref:Chs6p n=1 Tax=Saccharomycodes ludwigii TaxID=36035 RepID=UPI001E84C121|nr:hypothetical protein SCDLUD_003666 [Saccharomycodes ludwigii]KAH3900668.1 hypothetical protein SCDLUD_003666 [Saccharomycodes ludwigii]
MGLFEILGTYGTTTTKNEQLSSGTNHSQTSLSPKKIKKKNSKMNSNLKESTSQGSINTFQSSINSKGEGNGFDNNSSNNFNDNNGAYNNIVVPKILEREVGECLKQRSKIISIINSQGDGEGEEEEKKKKSEGEEQNDFGDKRLIFCDRFIGLPDLIHSTYPHKFTKKSVGEYFYITGLDFSNEDLPIAFISMLYKNYNGTSGNTINRKFVKSDLEASQEEIRKTRKPSKSIITICSYNLFSKNDVSIKIDMENCTYETYILENGDIAGDITLHGTNVISNVWDEVFVSGVIRCVMFNIDKEWKLPGMVELSGLFNNGNNYSQSILTKILDMLPRSLETGCDFSKDNELNWLNNYLVKTFSQILVIMPHLYDWCIYEIKLRLKTHIVYELILAQVLLDCGFKELEFMEFINMKIGTYYELYRNGDHGTELGEKILPLFLNLQLHYLLNYKVDYELAYPLASFCVKNFPLNYPMWEKLALVLIKLSKFKEALYVLNSMPYLLKEDPIKSKYIKIMTPIVNAYYCMPQHKSFYIGNLNRTDLNLTSNEIDTVATFYDIKYDKVEEISFGRIIMPYPTVGFIEKIWKDSGDELGPICFGENCFNLMNYVSMKEVQSVGDLKILKRNHCNAQYTNSTLKFGYNALVEISQKMGWKNFLDLRSSIFVMSFEASERLAKTKNKRICEEWLEQLFIDLYEDYKIVLEYQRQEKEEQESNKARTGIEWELLGLTLLRTHYYEDALVCLRTSMEERFDPFAAQDLIDLYLLIYTDNVRKITEDKFLGVLIKLLSYESRFYNYLQIPTILVFQKLLLNESLSLREKGVVNTDVNNISVDSNIDDIETLKNKCLALSFVRNNKSLISMMDIIFNTLPNNDDTHNVY